MTDLKRRRSGSHPLLPQDIIPNILMRLPVKSIIRFRCVCKDWKNLFETRSFIAEQLRHASHQKPSLLFEDFKKSDRFGLYLLDREMQFHEIPNNPFFDVTGSSLWMFASCNGLVCVGFSSASLPSLSLVVWNPATREVRPLPGSVSYVGAKDFCIGFGFSPIVDDYKIVKINAGEDDHLVNQVEVYSFGSASWRDVQCGKLNRVVVRCHGFSCNGSIFWIGSELAEHGDEDRTDIIVSFDIETEVFTLFAMPSSLSPVTNAPCLEYLTTHENKPALVSHTLSGDSESSLVHLLVMEEGTRLVTWRLTRNYDIRPFLDSVLVPVAIWRNQIVCNVGALPGSTEPFEDEDDPNGEQQMVMFDDITKESKRINIRSFSRGYGIFNYAESLVPVGNTLAE